MSCPCSSYTASSSMACPNDCTIPPWTWPSTSNGFRTLPQSSTATYLTSFTSPVSVSISTTQMGAPNGNVNFVASNKVVASRGGSIYDRNVCAVSADETNSPHGI